MDIGWLYYKLINLYVTDRQTIERFGTVMLFISGLLISVSPELAAEGWWVFLGFMIGHVIFITSATILKEWQWVELNVSFLVLDIYAIAIRLPIN